MTTQWPASLRIARWGFQGGEYLMLTSKEMEVFCFFKTNRNRRCFCNLSVAEMSDVGKFLLSL